jgi:hypothetical protein
MDMTDEQIGLTIDQIDAGDVFLISRDPAQPNALLDVYNQRRGQLAVDLLDGQRDDLRRQAVRSGEARSIPFRHRRCKVDGKAIGGYGVGRPSLWNPNREKHNGLEYWEGTGTSRKGVVWTFDVPADRAGKAHTFYWMGRIWGTGEPTGRMTLLNAAGKEVSHASVAPGDEQVHRWRVTPPAAGTYTIELIQKHDGEKGGRIGRAAFLVPIP